MGFYFNVHSSDATSHASSRDAKLRGGAPLREVQTPQ